MNIPSRSLSQHSLTPACRSSNGQPAPQKFIRSNSLYHSLSTIHQGPVQQVAKHKTNYYPQHQRVSLRLARERPRPYQGRRGTAEPTPQQLSLFHVHTRAAPGQEGTGGASPSLASPHSKSVLNFEGFHSHGWASRGQSVIELAALSVSTVLSPSDAHR